MTAKSDRSSVVRLDRASAAAGDFYRTPARGTRALLAAEQFPGTVWEPACGDGAMSAELERRGPVVSTDLYDRGYGKSGVDFLTCAPDFEFDHVVTNPPFSLAEKFARRALGVTPGKVALLCRLLWLESQGRKSFFEGTPLARVLVFSKRLNVSRNGEDFGDNGDGGMVAFAWYVWDKGHRGPATLGWV